MKSLTLFFQRMVQVLGIVAVVLTLVPAQMALGQSSVTQREIWDRSFTTSQTHAWHDFPVRATFTHSSGTTLTVDGYYDGENGSGQHVWTVRFTPTRAGTWNWATTSSDASLRASGSLQVAAPTSAQIAANPNYRGHVRVATSGARANRYFTYADGTPFFWLGDTAWEINAIRAGLGGGEYDNQRFYTWLDDRVNKGFTVIQTQFFQLNNRNEGGYPFPDNTQAPDGNGDFSTLSAEHFQYLDIRIRALFDRGLVIGAHPAWFSEYKSSLSDAKLISRYLMARYGAYNLIWSLSGEYQYKYPGSNVWDDATSGGVWELCWDYSGDHANSGCEWNQLGQAVQSYNAYGHALTIHPSGRPDEADPPEWGARAHEQSSAGEFHAQPWLTVNWTQTRHYDDHLFYVYQRTHDDYTRSPVKPTIHSEGFYENNRAEGADAYEVRWQMWTALLNGAAGHTYGAGGLTNFYDPNAPSGQTGVATYDATPWDEALNYPGSGYAKTVRDFFVAVPWWQLEPSREALRVNGSTPPPPSGSTITPPHAASIPNQLHILYLPRGNAGKAIQLTGLGSGPYVAQAFNPRSGVYSNLNGGNPITLSGGSWTVPAGTYADNDDWVIKLTSTTAPTPTATATRISIGETTPTPTATRTTPPGASATPGPAGAVKINFQTAGSITPLGYLPDAGQSFGDRGNGHSYGWNADNTANARDREYPSSPDQRYDTLNHMQLGGAFTWELAVPSGSYSVRVVAGDPGYYDTVYRIAVEGRLAVDGTSTASSRWLEGTVQVTVTDGRLTVSNGGGATFNKIAFIEITPTTGATQTATAPATATRTPGASSPTPSATPTATAAGQAFQEIGGQVVMEAENYDGNIARNGDAWTSRSNVAGYVGSGFMRTEPDDGNTITTGLATTSPEINYRVNVTTPGTYFVWLRVYAEHGGSDSVHVGLDGQTVAATTSFGFGASGSWVWTGGGSRQVTTTTAGVRVINIWMREDGAAVDRIMLTTDSNYTPNGNGPAESVRSGGQAFTPTRTNTAMPSATPLPASTSTRTPTQTTTAVATATHIAVPTSTPSPTSGPTQTPASGLNVKINFQPAGAAIPAAYLADTGEVYGDRGSGYQYGWNADNSDGARDRDDGLSQDQRYDTLLHMQRAGDFTWELALPNGAYTVRLVAGDPSYYDTLYQIKAEDVLIVDGVSSGTQRWLEGTVQVTVNDGRLTLSNPSAQSFKIAFIEIVGGAATATPGPTVTQAATATPAPTNTPPATPSVIKINFQKANVTVPEGYLPDAGKRFGSRNGYDYGWSADNRTGRDRDAANSPDQRYDTFVHMQRPNVCGGSCTWEITLPNGTYTVRVVAGDATATDSVYRLSVEGVLAIDGTPSENQRWFDNTVTVTVSDGRLTLSNAAGAQNNKVNFIEITTP
ncbi:MAG: apiosidase-like domain-containing protein [Anaerolineales bacterium]